jgi:hypothetical protein
LQALAGLGEFGFDNRLVAIDMAEQYAGMPCNVARIVAQEIHGVE